MKYAVTVTRIAYGEIQVTVEASNQIKAHRLAVEKAKNSEISSHRSRYEVSGTKLLPNGEVMTKIMVRSEGAMKHIAGFLIGASIRFETEPYPEDHWAVTVADDNVERVIGAAEAMGIEDLVEVDSK